MARLYSGESPDFAFALIDRIDVSALIGRAAPTRVSLDVAMLNPATGLPGGRATISAVLPSGASEVEVRRHLYATLRAFIAENATPDPREPASRTKRRELDQREGRQLDYQRTDYGEYDDEFDEGDDDDGDTDVYGPTVVYAIRYR